MTRILCPAKTTDETRQLIKAGANCVYAGLSGFCRNQDRSVTVETLGEIARALSEAGGFLVAAVNRIPQPGREDRFIKACAQALKQGARGVILNDPGLIRAVRDRFPDTLIMASVGMAPLNSREVRFIINCGADTVLTSEFLTPEEVTGIKKETGVSVEMFFRGVKEYGYTGKCIMSSYCHQKKTPVGMKGSAKRGGSCGPWCRQCFTITDTSSKVHLPRCRFELWDSLDAYLGVVDYFKTWQGFLKWNDFLDIITVLAQRINKAGSGANNGKS